MISELVKKFLLSAGEHPEHNILAKSLLFPDAGFFWLCVFTFMLALFLCLYLTPLVIQAAIRYDIVDRPDGRLKTHTTTTAYLGGVSIYLAFLFALSLTIQFSEEVLGLLLAGTMIILLGIIDDLRALSPKLKLFGQTVAVLVLIKSGIHIQIVFLPEGICLLLTFLWLMATINAFNIIDVMDGLSTGTGAVCSAVLFIVALLNGRPMIAIITISLAGALFGFLRFNIAPARIYLGDAGSMFLGLMLGSLAMVGSYTDNNDLGCLAPVLILGVPLFDTMFVMYIRWRRGVSVILGSPDHFALRLRKWRLSTRQTVLLSYGAGAALGLTGLGLMLSPSLQVSAALLLTVIVCGLTAGYYMKKIDMTM